MTSPDKIFILGAHYETVPGSGPGYRIQIPNAVAYESCQGTKNCLLAQLRFYDVVAAFSVNDVLTVVI